MNQDGKKKDGAPDPPCHARHEIIERIRALSSIEPHCASKREVIGLIEEFYRVADSYFTDDEPERPLRLN